MKRLLIAAVLALPLAATAGELPNYPFVHVSGTAYEDVMPDRGAIDFEIVGAGSAEEAAGIVAARAGEIRELMEGLGMPVDDLTIRDPRKDVRKDGVTMEVRAAVHIEVRDLSKWAALVQPLLDKPNLEGFITGMDLSERATVEAGLLTSATQNARREAEALAAGFGKKVGAVAGVSPTPLKNLTNELGLVQTNGFRGSAGPRPPRDRKEFLTPVAFRLQQTVHVLFRLR